MNIFVISDHHFGHANILTFTRTLGGREVPLRPEFSDVTAMNERMIAAWNAVVRPTDKVYHLGDVAIQDKHIALIDRCVGTKVLIRGNHDTAKTAKYLKHFKEVYATRALDRLLLSHYPVHPLSLGKCIANVHGHLHNNQAYGRPYINVCVECVNYTPVPLETLLKEARAWQ